MKFFNSILILFFSVCFFVTFLFCGNIFDSSGEEIDNFTVISQNEINSKNWDDNMLLPGVKEIIQKGKLVVAMTSSPIKIFCDKDSENNFNGLDVDIAKNLANSLGVKLEINQNAKTSNDLITVIESGKADIIISSFSCNLDRAACINLSKPYLNIRLGVLLNKYELIENNIEKNPLDYMKQNKIKLAIVKGTAYVNNAKEMFPNAEIIEMDSIDEVLDKVKSDEAFGCVMGEHHFIIECCKDPRLCFYGQIFVFSDILDKFCIGVPKEKNDLLSFVNAYVESSKSLTVFDIENEAKKKFDYN